MHPDIIKFWQDAGYTISNLTLSPPNTNPLDANTYFFIRKNYQIVPLLIANLLNNGAVKYEINGHWYSETEALRIIKLKAFV